MLYDKSKAPFSEELFKVPTSEYRGTPFWAWNCKLEKNELLRQINVLHQMGFGGFHMHVRTGMATDYMSDEYMELVKACVDKAKKDKMLAWLYDEDRWPSGAAGGKVTKEEKYRIRFLVIQPTPLVVDTENDPMQGRASLLACFDISLNENGELSSYRIIGEEEQAKGIKWYAYLKISDRDSWYNNFTYVNTLNKEAIERFIETTHEVYAEKVGKHFGKTVPAIFSDEPQFTRKQPLADANSQKGGKMPWTDDLPETFYKTYGENLIEHIPELFWELPEGKVSTVRYHFHDHIAERFAEAFSDTLGKWCDEHKIMLTGHMMSEPILTSQSDSVGDCMRSYRSFGLPGIDMLCNHYEFTTAKQCQSAVHQYGRPGMLSELYGVTGWDYDLRRHKLQGDWQAALGVTVRVPHLSWLSMEGEAKRDYPASINYQSPWYTEYSYIENHFARVNTALTRGKPVVKVGVIHPIESVWLHYGPVDTTESVRKSMDKNFTDIAEWLLRNQIDFDYISESLLSTQCKRGGAPLKVGCMEYDAIVVPNCETLRKTTLARLQAFRKAGGRLIFVGSAPTMVDAVENPEPAKLWARSVHISHDRNSLLAALKDFRTLSVCRSFARSPYDKLVYQMRQEGDEKWLFFAPACMPGNVDVAPAVSLDISVKGEYEVWLYDTLTGEKSLAEHRANNGTTVIRVRAYEMDSFLFRMLPKAGSVYAPEKKIDGLTAVAASSRVAYSRSEPNVLVLDMAEYALDDEPFAPEEEILRIDSIIRIRLGWNMRTSQIVQPYMVPEEAPEHTLRLRFKVQSRVSMPVKLALECAGKTKIIWNGAEITCAPKGYFTDKSIQCVSIGKVKKGENILELTMPFVHRSNPEWCYLLGEFGVELLGRERTLCELPETLVFDSITNQKYPYYTGNITYHMTVAGSGNEMFLRVPHYRGGIISVAVDGKQKGRICIQPYMLSLGVLSEGEHKVDITLFGNRFNAFGSIHDASEVTWTGPNAWRTIDFAWTYEYRLRPLGIISTPLFFEKH